MKHKYSGFTIVELLIVIVIIGILVSLVITTYNGVQAKAEYTRTRDSMAKVEKAFRLKAIADGGYQSDQYYITCMGFTVPDYMASNSGSNNVWIGDIIADCHDKYPLDSYLQASDYEDVGVPLVYDNDSDTYTLPCDNDRSRGVNLYFGGVLGDDKMTQLDQDTDQGNGLSCGKIRKNGSQEYFMISTYSYDGV